eukprot:TRINITY_DN13050_c0_g1_i1.p1 TRINITY_DN13050_c0_g1~~TRINITY_DN13050_c0_g1_i1.p1  ORF type:complete len:177 (+),score=37.80 TRINITY_DN13050_c0_g1_i1:223-753(+)
MLTRKLIKQNKLDYPQWKKDVAMMCYIGTQFCLKIFHECATGEMSIKQKLFEVYIEGFFELYETATQDAIQMDTSHCSSKAVVERDAFLVGLINWLENYCPPAVIEKNMIKLITHLGIDTIRDNHFVKFKQWAQEIHQNVDFKSLQNQIPVLERFKDTHNWFFYTFVVNHTLFNVD